MRRMIFHIRLLLSSIILLSFQLHGHTSSDVFHEDSTQIALEEKATTFFDQVQAVDALRYQKRFVHPALRRVFSDLEDSLLNSFTHWSDHQKVMMEEEEKFQGVVISSIKNVGMYLDIHQHFMEQINYLKEGKDWKSGFAILVNAASKRRGGQKAYLLNLWNGELLEVPVSTAWKGIGYQCDTGKTPLGYFTISLQSKDTTQWFAETVSSSTDSIFHIIEQKKWLGETKWLHRVSTEKEKANILSNQYALEGKNDGKEYVPLSAPDYYYHQDNSVYFLNNLNARERQLYIHGTNRIEQLGMAFSGGCIRTSNIFSYIIKEILKYQQEIPVFIDAIPLKNISQRVAASAMSNKVSKLYEKNITVYDYPTICSIDKALVLENAVNKNVIHAVSTALLNDPKAKVKITMGGTVPLPESALKDWLEIKANPDLFFGKKFYSTYDLNGNHYKSRLVNDQAVRRPYGNEDGALFVEKRKEATKAFIIKQVSKRLEEYEVEIPTLKEQIIFEDDFLGITKSENLPNLDYFNLSAERKCVVRHMEILDSLWTTAPEFYEIRDELLWLLPLLEEGEMQVTSKKGVVHQINYKDGLLAQAYIFAIGEIYLKKTPGLLKHFVNKGMCDVSPKGEIIPYSLEFYLELDRRGRIELYHFSRVESKFGSQLHGDMKQLNERLIGLRMFAEEYFSKYKVKENRLYITTELLINNVLLTEDQMNK